MGLFKQKNKKVDDDFAQEVPQFNPNSDKEKPKLPELPTTKESKEEMFPSYKREFSGIKREIQKPVFTAPKPMPMPRPQMKPQPAMRQEMPEVGPAIDRPHVAGDKPIYVKIDQYKDAMETVDKIKDLCNEADRKLGEISKLRASEDRELEQWQADVDKIKDKLLQIDKKLFEI